MRWTVSYSEHCWSHWNYVTATDVDWDGEINNKFISVTTAYRNFRILKAAFKFSPVQFPRTMKYELFQELYLTVLLLIKSICFNK